MKLAESAPRTKDGEHEIVFVPVEYKNHGFSLRLAHEGRRLWELVHVLRTDKERSEHLSAKYPQFLFRYDAVADDEGLFHSISVPYIGRFGQIDNPDAEWPEGNTLIPPFFPIWYHPAKVIEHITQGTYKDAEVKVLNSQVTLWGDSPNKFMHTRDMVEPIGEETLYARLPQMEKECDIKDQIENLARSLDNFSWYIKRNHPELDSIRKEEGLMGGLENIATFYVLRALADAHKYQRSPGDFADGDIYSLEEKDKVIIPTVELARKMADSAVALCQEYLEEMK